MSHRVKRLAAGLTVLLNVSLAQAATEWSAQDYDLYPGDFNGDGKADILYIAKDGSKASGIAISDGSAPNVPWQQWASTYLGIQWYGSLYSAIVADYNNDGRSDVLLQRSAPGDNYLLLADGSGRLTGISQTIGADHLGLGWSKDQHTLLPGDLSGDGRDDLFFQAAEPAGVNAIPLADGNGQFSSGPTQTFTDASWPVFKWSRKNSVITSGDFNGDGRADLLVQSKPSFVTIDYDVPITIPIYAPNSFGVVYSQGGTTPLQLSGVQQWSRQHNGVDWAPSSAVPVVGDFNGDGRDDVLLQARNAGRPTYLLTANASGAAFSAPVVVTSNVSLSADNAKLVAGSFGGNGAGLYVQNTTPGGSNYIAPAVSASVVAGDHDLGVVSNSESVRYTYDAKGRLTGVQRTGGSNNNVQTQYTYDKANNRKSVVTTGSGNPAPP